VLSAIVAIVCSGAYWISALGPPPLGEALAFSTLVVDRDGKLLRPYATPEGRWRMPATRENVDPRFLQLLLAYEDKRFYAHPGIDPYALGRAFAQLATQGRIVSGASTITMQVARLLEPRAERSFNAKLRQMLRALEIERALSKDEVLALYLSLAPYGGNLEGVRAASLAYFGKEPRRLTLGEAAMLVALPQSPERRRPDRSSRALREARDRVLERAAASSIFPLDEIERAKREPVPDTRRPMPILAPHAAEAAVAAAPQRNLHRLTIDAALQTSLEELARERARALGPDISVAILAVDHANGDVLARVASADYFDTRRAGQVDMTSAVRSPGSTLKPFIYGLGFEDGLIHPETLIEDRPIRFGGYAPENFDLHFQGTVTVRRALQLSLNVPAVAVLDRVSPSRFAAARTRQAGSLRSRQNEVPPGLAISLGGVRRSTMLVALYAGWPGSAPQCRSRSAARAVGGSDRAPAVGSDGRLVCRQHPAGYATP
jgi:penicillin-binding protein 1C